MQLPIYFQYSPYGLSPRNCAAVRQHRRLSFESASDDRWPPARRGEKIINLGQSFKFISRPKKVLAQSLALLTFPSMHKGNGMEMVMGVGEGQGLLINQGLLERGPASCFIAIRTPFYISHLSAGL